jgi:K+ transporter
LPSFQANVSNLIGLYAIGVFISFTLSQAGMLVRWLRKRGRHWALKAIVNGTGAVVTAITVAIIGISKFSEGAYIVIILLPLLIFLMTKVKKHYTSLAIQLHISEMEYKDPKITKRKYNNRVIVPISSINKSSVRALRYAKTICGNITAFSVVTSDEEEQKLLENYEKLKNTIPLVIRKSVYRKIVSPLLEYIDSAEYDYQKGDIITVVLPQFNVQKWWHNILHHQTRLFVQRKLLKKKHIAIVTIPFQLHDDDEVLSRNDPGKE